MPCGWFLIGDEVGVDADAPKGHLGGAGSRGTGVESENEFPIPQGFREYDSDGDQAQRWVE